MVMHCVYSYFRHFHLGVLLVGIFFSSLLIPQLHAEHQTPQDSANQEIYLNFSYSLGIVNTVVTALYSESSEYLPLGQLFSLLHIHYQFDHKQNVAEGFYITESRRYVINFNTGTARVDTATFILASDDYIRSTFDIYVKPSVLERLFGLRFRVDIRRLTLSLETKEELPIVAERNREQQQDMLESQKAAAKEHPLLYPRQNNFFDGGFFDYSLTASSTKNFQSYGYNLQGGGIVAGGDLTLTANGNYSSSIPSSSSVEGEWRYVIDENPYISNIQAGFVNTSNLFSRNFKGIKIFERTCASTDDVSIVRHRTKNISSLDGGTLS